MSMADPIADMLTRIRNASLVGHQRVAVPGSRIKKAILQILLDEGFVSGIEDDDNMLQVRLKFDSGRKCVIQGLQRVSTPGRRRYVGKDEIPYVRNGLGIAILTTPQGVLTDRSARHAGVGGEVLCYVW
jgi:small subunit ribosomal protein S8